MEISIFSISIIAISLISITWLIYQLKHAVKCPKCHGIDFRPESEINEERKEIQDFYVCQSCGHKVFVNAEPVPYETPHPEE